MLSRISLTRVNDWRGFAQQRRILASKLLEVQPFDRGEVHAQKVVSPQMITKELSYVDGIYHVGDNIEAWNRVIQPNQPWADEHFEERVSGRPLNPPPSHERWPFNRAGNEEHLDHEGKFSHTYPERFWPRWAGYSDGLIEKANPIQGIRYFYGDLGDVVTLLKRNKNTRQAYLPVWFPEDLNAAVGNERVPCTLGYHFMSNRLGQLNVTYPMRSCDFMRFMPDDIYFAGRLLQWVAFLCGMPANDLLLTISSLHCFMGDEPKLKLMEASVLDAEEDDDDWLAGR